jgi:ubiquinone/menaquinone biosynthesis C-methylase UbiE
LSASKELLENHGFRDRILSIQQASAKNLEHMGDSSVDTVLMLGPLYHLQDLEDRKKAIREAQRILKPGGLLFAAGINRLAYFREFCRDSQYFKKFHPNPSTIFPELLSFIEDGNLSNKIGLSLAGGHLTTIDEFKELFSPEFQICEISGLESFFAHQQEAFLKKTSDIDLWLELVELTGKTAEGLASSEHIMFIGKRI